MRRSYVAAHDGTERGADAVALARTLAHPSGMPVRMVHVCVPAEDNRAERARALTLEAQLRLPGDPLPLNMTAHSVAHGLQEVAEREPAALVVLASSPSGERGRTFPGPTAQRLLHGAPCPVAVAPDGYASRGASEIRVIAVAIDVDPDSREAVRHAMELARRYDACVRVMTAVAPDAVERGARISCATCSPTCRATWSWRPSCVRGRLARRSSRRATRTSTCSCAARGATGPRAWCCSGPSRPTSWRTRAAPCSSCREVGVRARRPARRTRRGGPLRWSWRSTRPLCATSSRGASSSTATSSSCTCRRTRCPPTAMRIYGPSRSRAASSCITSGSPCEPQGETPRVELAGEPGDAALLATVRLGEPRPPTAAETSAREGDHLASYPARGSSTAVAARGAARPSGARGGRRGRVPGRPTGDRRRTACEMVD